MRIIAVSVAAFLGLCRTVSSEPVDVFPEEFLLGFATASYQIEGGWNEDGKGENVWDRFTHEHPERIKDGANGDVAADSYHRHSEDVEILKSLGAQIYRFSLSWSRILPTGDVDVINQPGINFYNRLIDNLLANGIQPMVTLYHWDLPEPLQELGGWPNPVIADYFEQYARVAFRHFGDRVKWWITMNEPIEVCLTGYGEGMIAPSVAVRGIAEYLCGHTLLLAHARAYHVYDTEFRSKQKGKVGITLSGGWNEPLTSKPDDVEASERIMQFQVGWFANPVLLGDYPAVMRRIIDKNSRREGRTRSRLPVFKPEDVSYVNGTADFLGVNHYTTYLARNERVPSGASPSWERDVRVALSRDPKWPTSRSPWLKVVPWGFRRQLNWLAGHYPGTPLFVTENGYSDDGRLNDCERITYHREYILQMLDAIREDKCRVIGYAAWSLIDNFEWLDGYEFGVYHVDFTLTNRTRTAKASAKFFREMYTMRRVPSESEMVSREQDNEIGPPETTA